MPNSLKVVQRLLAHARLCREIASASWDEKNAQKLEEMALACERSAIGTEPAEPAPPCTDVVTDALGQHPAGSTPNYH
jgi:hypothetical protein